MKPLYTNKEFNDANPNDKLSCSCYQCGDIFKQTKHDIQAVLNPNHKRTGMYCSKKCQFKSQIKKIVVNCLNCSDEFEKLPNQIKKHKNHFCSRSCSTTYNNKHKTTGNRRSKLEKWIEEQLTKLYPNLHIDYNKKSAICSELDIYIPSLNLAIELNGVFHYEPIYGVDKLNQIKENDISKSKACHEAKIDLCVIDTSSQTYFKESTSQKYLSIVIDIINGRC